MRASEAVHASEVVPASEAVPASADGQARQRVK